MSLEEIKPQRLSHRNYVFLLLPLIPLVLSVFLLHQTGLLEEELSAGRQRGLDVLAQRESHLRQSQLMSPVRDGIATLSTLEDDVQTRVLGQIRHALNQNVTELRYEQVDVTVPKPLLAFALELSAAFGSMPELLGFLARLTEQQAGTRVDLCDVGRADDGQGIVARCIVRWLFREAR